MKISISGYSDSLITEVASELSKRCGFASGVTRPITRHAVDNLFRMSCDSPSGRDLMRQLYTNMLAQIEFERSMSVSCVFDTPWFDHVSSFYWFFPADTEAFKGTAKSLAPGYDIRFFLSSAKNGEPWIFDNRFDGLIKRDRDIEMLYQFYCSMGSSMHVIDGDTVNDCVLAMLKFIDV